MSERKYAVRCKLASNPKFIFGVNKEDGYYSIEIYPGSNYSNPHFKTHFTKSELAEIMGGAILKRIPGGTPLDELGKDKSCYVWLDDCNYWKNPLIELVPVEDGE
ncbi:MAG: hypothetical protein L0G03_11135 [Lactococcus lactis]|jgi:hypothetical protein|uniref:hypothetical protein n=1 Tax=Lactococcus lactis TaxID=1358 RepID=UPI00264DF8E9|nr:hypothetical protein [Lactococcus lactis]MDN6255565.1 hypothetical protein [Tetragenococcus koreensis]MDN5439428.1 hypothetical protein [Lactococcus lactis]MDN6220775.1 hypothetical protein [Lactococcus lactis]MDN6279232.1 hypothetical protein [Lactococcus lactis]